MDSSFSIAKDLLEAWNFSKPKFWKMWHVLPTIRVICNVNCIIETEGLLNVTGIRCTVKVVIRCKTEAMLLQTTNKSDV